MFVSLLLTFLAIFSSCILAKSNSGQRLLVALDGENVEKDFSKVIQSLKGRDFEVTVAALNSSPLFVYGERQYDHVVMLAPELSKWTTDFDAKSIVKFVEEGGNVVITTSPSSRNPVRALAADLGFLLQSDGEYAVDHSQFHEKLDSTEGSAHSVISLKSISPFDSGISLAYRGIGHRLSKENPLLFPLVEGNPSTVSKPLSGDGKAADTEGSDLKLVSALQARNNARIVFSGSVSIFRDAYYEAVNQKFVDSLLQWCFQENNVLRVKSVYHHIVGSKDQQPTYRIKDNFVYEVAIEQYQSNGKWTPFTLPKGDKLQLELVMLDPYIRTNLRPSNKTAGLFVTPDNLMLPDHYGVFTLNLQYQRRGFSYIEEKSTLSIVPFRHDEYPRFLTAAFPYYASSMSMIVAFFVFTLIFLFGSFDEKTAGQAKNE